MSFKQPLKILTKLFTGFSFRVGIFSITLPFFKTNDRDFAGLKLTRAYVVLCSNPFYSHRVPVTDDVVTVKSSIKALIGG